MSLQNPDKKLFVVMSFTNSRCKEQVTAQVNSKIYTFAICPLSSFVYKCLVKSTPVTRNGYALLTKLRIIREVACK